jgi:hypothetical protein
MKNIAELKELDAYLRRLDAMPPNLMLLREAIERIASAMEVDFTIEPHSTDTHIAARKGLCIFSISIREGRYRVGWIHCTDMSHCNLPGTEAAALFIVLGSTETLRYKAAVMNKLKREGRNFISYMELAKNPPAEEDW